ncbi:OLC1v1019515C2 [Oldenlandia corymbosa var. corymbosa]|uniref:OLC1v1019515C2 n=1 Tax=Oldenlandia corymbosa var. corymbosa TaxID=529605 RepID=A0AAV1EED2_OLDCO|nr:OLC1v1019515C2 [Oldenlandia corymbosa var. corymbosa]
MDPVVEEVEKVKRDFEETEKQILEHIKLIEGYGKSSASLSSEQGEQDQQSKDSLPRLNGLAQDCLSSLQSLHFQLDLLAPQLPVDDQVKQAQDLAESWQKQIQSLRLNLRHANLQAKENLKRTAQQERELLLGGGGESTARRRNLQTKAGMTSAAESITESLRRTRQLMVQEVERSASTLMTLDESTTVLSKAESEYRGHRSLLMRTRNLLSTMQRQDVLDRIIIVVGFLLFTLAVLYVVSKRIGLLKLQRKLMDAVRTGTIKELEILPRVGRDAVNIRPPQVNQEAVPLLDVPLDMHDEL